MELTHGEETGAKESVQGGDQECAGSDEKTRDQSNQRPEYRYLKNSLTVKSADAGTMVHITSTLLKSIKLAQQIKDSILSSQFMDVLLKTFRDDTGSIGMEANFSEAPPGVPTMLGPMEIRASMKQRAAVKEQQGKVMEISQSQEVLDVDEEIEAEIKRNMLAMVNILHAKKSVKLQALVLNRGSFTETVENLFALSFLVKDGRAEIKIAEDKNHIIVPRDAASLRECSDGDIVNTQFMFRFDYQDWELMREQVQVGEELMQHRKHRSIERLSTSTKSSDDADSVMEPLPRNVQIAWPLVIPKGVRNKVRRRTTPVTEAEMHVESLEKGPGDRLASAPVIATESHAAVINDEPARREGAPDFHPNRNPAVSRDTRSQDEPRQERVSGDFEASAVCEEAVEDEMNSRKRMRVAGNGGGVISAVDENSLCNRDAEEPQEKSTVQKSPRRSHDTLQRLSSGNHQEGAVGGEELRNTRMPEETVTGGDNSCCDMPHAGSAALDENKSTKNGIREDNGRSEEENLVTVSKPRATQLLTYSRRRPREKPSVDEVATRLPQNTFDIIKKYTRRALSDDETPTNNEASSLYKRLVGIPIKKRIGRISCGSDDAEAIFERLASAPKRKRTSCIDSPTNQVERSKHEQSSPVGGLTALNAPRRYRKSSNSKKTSSELREASSPDYKLKDDDASGGEDVKPLVIAPKRFKKSALDPRRVLVAKVKARLKAIFKQSK